MNGSNKIMTRSPRLIPISTLFVTTGRYSADKTIQHYYLLNVIDFFCHLDITSDNSRGHICIGYHHAYYPIWSSYRPSQIIQSCHCIYFNYTETFSHFQTFDLGLH